MDESPLILVVDLELPISEFFTLTDYLRSTLILEPNDPDVLRVIKKLLLTAASIRAGIMHGNY
jgi:hypothetical protein